MKQVFKPGDIKEYRSVVRAEDVAAFQGVVVHAVCSTFALARDIEWTTRQFVLDMLADDEEGIGTYLEIEHLGPAFVGEEIVFRGVAYAAIRRHWRPWPSAVLSSLIFAAFHLNAGELIPLTIVGVGFAFAYEAGRSIGCSIAAHAALNLVVVVGIVPRLP